VSSGERGTCKKLLSDISSAVGGSCMHVPSGRERDATGIIALRSESEHAGTQRELLAKPVGEVLGAVDFLRGQK
jgi:hypothetical protein